MIFLNYLTSYHNNIEENNFLEQIIFKIYRNLELVDFSSDMNHDLISEIFYSCECLNMINCIETKEMITYLAEYLFPQEIVDKVVKSTEIGKTTSSFNHLKINRNTGEIV